MSKDLPVVGFFCRERVGRVEGCEMVCSEGLLKSLSRDPEQFTRRCLGEGR